jgi:hypothetical protein
MSPTAAEIQTVLDAWPEDDASPASVKLLFGGWQGLRMPAINAAVQALNDDPTSGFTTPRGRGHHHKIHKCRTLTMHGVPVAAGGPTPSPEEMRSMLPPADGAGDAVSERMRLLEQEVRESRQTLTQQAAITDSLVRQAAAMDADRDVTADYEIHADVLKLIPKSFLKHRPLSMRGYSPWPA